MRFAIRKVVGLDGSEMEIIMCDAAQIPADENNRHFVDYLAWLAEGHEPEEWSGE